MARSPRYFTRIMKHIDQFYRSAKTHINIVCSPLQLEYGGLFPFIQQDIYCKEKADNANKKKEPCHWKQEKNGEALVEAFYSHDDSPTNQTCDSKMRPLLPRAIRNKGVGNL